MDKTELQNILKLSKQLGLAVWPGPKKYGNPAILIPPHIFESETFRGLLKDLDYDPRLVNHKIKVPSGKRKTLFTYSIITNLINTNKVSISISDLKDKTWEEIKDDPQAVAFLVEEVYAAWNSHDSYYRRPRKVNNEMVRGYIKLQDSGEWTHKQIVQSIHNYALWARCAKEDEKVWFHRWDLDQYLLSDKAIFHCWDRKMMISDKKLNVGRADSKQIKYYTREELFAEDAE